MNWAQAEARFFEETRERLRPLTRQHIRRQLQHFQAWSRLSGPDLVQAVHVQNYLEALLQANTRETAWGYLSRLKRFFQWASRVGLLLWDPMASLKAPRFRRRLPRVLAQGRVRSWLQAFAPGTRERVLLELFYGTGLRLDRKSVV